MSELTSHASPRSGMYGSISAHYFTDTAGSVLVTGPPFLSGLSPVVSARLRVTVRVVSLRPTIDRGHAAPAGSLAPRGGYKPSAKRCTSSAKEKAATVWTVSAAVRVARAMSRVGGRRRSGNGGACRAATRRATPKRL